MTTTAFIETYVITNITESELSALRFLARRYASAAALSDGLVRHYDDVADIELCAQDIHDICELGREDGADWGTIPCLGGRLGAEWERVRDEATVY